MSIKYYDAAAGRNRIKRRYVWAFWGFCSGFVCAVLLLSLLR